MTAPQPAVGDRYEHDTHGVCTVVLGPDADSDFVVEDNGGRYRFLDLNLRSWHRVEDPPITALSVWERDGGEGRSVFVVVLADHEADDEVQCGRLYEWCQHEQWLESSFRKSFRPVEAQR